MNMLSTYSASLVFRSSRKLYLPSVHPTRFKSFNEAPLKNYFNEACLIFPSSPTLMYYKLYSTSAYYKSVFDVDTSVKEDTVLYESNSAIVYTLNYVVAFQFFFWAYGAYLIYSATTDLPEGDVIVFNWFNMKDKKIKYGLPMSFVLAGFIMAWIPYSYAVHMVRRLTLLKGGKDVHLTTYGLYNRYYDLKIPVEKMNCVVSREAAKTYVNLKWSNKRWHFLLDKEGEFPHPQLFDMTVGMHRNFSEKVMKSKGLGRK